MSWGGILLGILGGLAEPTNIQLSGAAEARFQNVVQHLEAWDVVAAKSELAEVPDNDGQFASIYRYFAGRIAFEEGRYADAVAAFTAAGAQPHESGWLKLASDTQQVMLHHAHQQSAHFEIWYPPGKDEVLVPWALEALESARAAIEKDFGYAPSHRVRVEILNTAQELSKVSTLSLDHIKTTGTIAICKFSKLMVTSPKSVLHGYDFIDRVTHEYIHLVVSQKSHNTVPIWLHEGLAKYFERRWRGAAGTSMTPSTLALLGKRVHAKTLVPFSKMHPSMALLPSAEDAATAFAEVYYAVDFIRLTAGATAVDRMLSLMAQGYSDQRALEAVTGMKWAQFELAWMRHISALPFPDELLPPTTSTRHELADAKAEKPRGDREISFGDFLEVRESPIRRLAHLGELMRERERHGAARYYFALAHGKAPHRYESISNKYALTLLNVGDAALAARVLEDTLRNHPDSAQTLVHAGRALVALTQFSEAYRMFERAVAVDPFDPTVHLGLALTATTAGKPEVALRAKQAASVLTGVPQDELLAAAKLQFSNTNQYVARAQAVRAGDAGIATQPTGVSP